MIENLYHGSYAKDIRKFNLNYLEGGEHNLGIGIYFTKNKEVLGFYSEDDDYKGNVYIIDLNCSESEIRNVNDTLTANELLSLIKKFRLSLTKEEIDNCLKQKMENIHFYIFNKFLFIENKYKFSNKEFLKKFVKATKIKVITKEAPYNDFIRTDYCVMDPRVIKLKKIIDLKKEKECFLQQEAIK